MNFAHSEGFTCLPAKTLLPATRNGISGSYSGMTNSFATLWSKTKTFSLVAALALTICSMMLAQENAHPAANDGAVQVQMHNVMYHYSDNASVHLRDVGGMLVPTTPGADAHL